MDRLTVGALLEGRPWPLGAHAQDGGANVAVFSDHAQAIELCVFDEDGAREIARRALPGRTGDVFHGFLPGAGPGLVYGLRAHGAWRPDHGLRFNPHKLLLDPYAREIVGTFEWRDEHFDHERGHLPRMDTRDNAPYALKSRLVAEPPPPADTRPGIALADTVLYELHVKGFTRLHEGIAPAQRGTYAALASDPVIAHLKRLGVTTLCLLPVHQHLDEERLAARGLSNYWGYNTVGYFALEPRYAGGARRHSARQEFRAAVQRLHEEGLEVVLDVVFNHTAETEEIGPTICWRGLDNLAYYRHVPGEPGHCENFTGCGNTLDLRHPRVLQMVTDSLRWWARAMNVDGFRFDLAPVLGRGDAGFDRGAPFFHAVAQDPLLGRLKLIAEPWDVGPGGYRLGDFPRGWLEWNDRFRDGMRGYWLGHTPRGEFARRLAGSSDVFHTRHRSPLESVNLLTAHDGFTLRDLVSHDHKHNDANGEGNRDGHAHNHSWNCGVEGETDDPAVLARRARLQRALLATLLLAQGTPMLTAGDELGHGQRGNNNPYCQDNEIAWIAWPRADAALVAFVARVTALRRERGPLGAHWYTGRADEHGVEDLGWWDASGRRLQAGDWASVQQRALGARIGTPGRPGAPLLLLANPHGEDVAFALPAGEWQALLDTARGEDGGAPWRGASPYPLAARSLALLECVA